MQMSALGNIVLAFIQTFQNVVISLPGCPWCEKAKDLLQIQCFEFYEFAVDSTGYLKPGSNLPNIHIQQIQNQYNYRSYPMIFLNGQFIQGYSNLETLVENGMIEKYRKTIAPKTTSMGN